MCNDWGGGLGVGSTAAAISGLGWDVGIVSDDIRLVCCAANVAVSLQNLFCSDIRGVRKELIILQD